MNASLARTALESAPDALRKLDPRHLVRTPVIFVVWVGSVLTTVLSIMHPSVFSISVTIWLWLTILFANLAEAIAEGRGKAQADTLRQTRVDSIARRLMPHGGEERVPGTELRVGDRVVVEAGEAAEFETMTPHAFAALDSPAEVIMIFDRDGHRAHRHDGA